MTKLEPYPSSESRDPSRKSGLRVVWEQFQTQLAARMALWVLAVLGVGALFAPMISPYGPNEERVLEGIRNQAPVRVHIVDDKGVLRLPFVYATTRRVNPETFETEFLENRDVTYPVRLFVRRSEAPYLLFGFIPSDLRLFGVDKGAYLYLLGTDSRGRDLFSRLWHGAQVSLSIGLVSVFVTFGVGVVLGGLAGFYGGFMDALVMRSTEVMGAIPPLFLLIALSTLLPGGLEPIAYFFGLVFLIGVSGWGELARGVRAQVYALREQEYVAAGRALGASDTRIVAQHLLPNLGGYLIVLASTTIPAAILAESALSFLGLGIRPPLTSWGAMLAEVASGGFAAFDSRPWTLAPGVLIVVAVVGWNLIGDGLRVAVDPKKRR